MRVVTAESDYEAGIGHGRSAGRLVLRPRAPRRLRERIAIAAVMLSGAALLAVAVLSADDAIGAGVTALCGTIAIAIAAVAVAETASLRRVGAVALACSAGFALSILPATSVGAPEVARLVAALVIGLASTTLITSGGREPF